MPNVIQHLCTVDEDTYPYIIEQNVSIKLQPDGLIRCNVYLPKDVRRGQKYPVIITYGPYGKDVPYQQQV